MLAQRTHAPNLVILFEAGGVAPQLPTMPVSVGDSTTFHRAVMATQHGRRDAVLPARDGRLHVPQRGADRPVRQPELDAHRRHYEKPKVRLPGSGGANDLASFCWRTLIVMKHDAKKFVEKLDFLTTPGYLTGPGAREAAGLPAGTGPHRVITDLCVLDFAPGHEADAGEEPAPRQDAGAGAAPRRASSWRRATPSQRPSNRTSSSCASFVRKWTPAGMSWGGRSISI